MDSTIPTAISQSLDLKNFISKKYLQKLMNSCVRNRNFNPVSTLYCFLMQALSNGSNKEALANYNAVRIKNNMKPVSMNDSAYCKARSKLDCETLRELCLDAGKRVEEESSG